MVGFQITWCIAFDTESAQFVFWVGSKIHINHHKQHE